MTPQQMAQAGIVFGLVAALRRAWPNVDGRLVWLWTIALSMVVSFGANAHPTIQQVIWSGLLSAVGALALDGAMARAREHMTPGPSVQQTVLSKDIPPVLTTINQEVASSHDIKDLVNQLRQPPPDDQA